MSDAGARAIGEEARGTARLIVTTTPGVTMTVLAQEELVDAIAAALVREAEARAYLEGERASVCDLLNSALRDTQLAEQQVAPERLKTGIEALWFQLNDTYAARVRAEGERDEAFQLIATGASRGAEISPFIRRIFAAASRVARERDEALRATERLEAALRAYGTHKPTCAVNGDARHSSSAWLVVTNPQPCDCGLDAALAPPERSRVAAPAEDAREEDR